MGCDGIGTAMDCWKVVLLGRPSTPPDREPAARGRGAVRRRYPPDARKPRLGLSSSREDRPHQGAGDRQHLLLAAREAAGQLLASGADLFPDHLRRFTLIGPSALAQTNRLGSIHGQKKELRDLVRRPPFTARLTATDSALPPRESAMGCSRYGPLATVTPDPQLYCEACFVVSDHGCIRPMMYARVLIHGAMDVTSPPGFL